VPLAARGPHKVPGTAQTPWVGCGSCKGSPLLARPCPFRGAKPPIGHENPPDPARQQRLPHPQQTSFFRLRSSTPEPELAQSENATRPSIPAAATVVWKERPRSEVDHGHPQTSSLYGYQEERSSVESKPEGWPGWRGRPREKKTRFRPIGTGLHLRLGRWASSERRRFGPMELTTTDCADVEGDPGGRITGRRETYQRMLFRPLAAAGKAEQRPFHGIAHKWRSSSPAKRHLGFLTCLAASSWFDELLSQACRPGWSGLDARSVETVLVV
jgi:hypothetical protein